MSAARLRQLRRLWGALPQLRTCRVSHLSGTHYAAQWTMVYHRMPWREREVVDMVGELVGQLAAWNSQLRDLHERRVLEPPRHRRILDRRFDIIDIELHQEVELDVRLPQPLGQFLLEEILGQGAVRRRRRVLERPNREFNSVGPELDRRRTGELFGRH